MSENGQGPRGMKTFLIIWLGELISIMGSGLTGFALGVWIFQQTGQATPFALVVLFSTLPRLLLTPWAGSLADRWNRRLLMILGDTGSALCTLMMVALVAADRLDVWHLYILVTISAAFSTFQEPAYTASVSMLVPKKDLARASGLMQVGQSVETLISPLLGGVLFGLIGFEGIVLIDFITFFAAVGALLVVRIPQPEVVEEAEGQKAAGKPSVWSDTVFGWRYLWQRVGVFWLLWYFALVNFLLNLSAVLLGPMVLSYGDATQLGIVQTATGLGMLLGSIFISAWGGARRRVPVVIGAIALSAVGLAVTGVQPSVYFSAGGMFLMLLCIPIASASSQAIFQSKVAPGVQGRVFAMRSLISRSMMPVAYLLAGPLADRVFNPLLEQGGALASGPLGQWVGVGPGRGIGLIFVVSGLLLIVVSAAAYAAPRIRNLESELADEIDLPAAQANQSHPQVVAN